MKVDWKDWDIGGYLIFGSGCAATLSMFMKWIDALGFTSQTGIKQGTLFFLCFWIYPVAMAFKKQPINLTWGLVSSVPAFLFILYYISSKSVQLYGKTITLASNGAWLFLFASTALILGIFMYGKEGAIEEKKDGTGSWVCLCGEENEEDNSKEIQNCKNCGINKDYALSKMKKSQEEQEVTSTKEDLEEAEKEWLRSCLAELEKKEEQCINSLSQTTETSVRESWVNKLLSIRHEKNRINNILNKK